MKNFFSKFFYPILILILVGFLAWKNYTPGTTLSGWDTLHPEFNFSLYLNRIFYGAWQEHQGIGAPAAQAPASDLTRLPIVYLLAQILPHDLVRYSFFFLTLATGTLGVYFLARYFLSERLTKYIGGASFLAAVFYVLNLATMQQYYDPLEMFAVHFATLPWLILLAAKYLKGAEKKNLIWFSLVTLLSSSMASTATLFYVYFAALSLFILTLIFINRNKSFLKRGVLLLVITITLNLFWLGPNIYYIVNESGTVENAKINRTFSDEAYLQSRAFGNIESLGMLKNFPFNWREYDFSSNSFEDLMRVWDVHLSKPGVSEIGYGAVIFALLGILIVLFRKSKSALALVPILILSAAFWLIGIPREFTILWQALRFPFTKFSILLICALSVFLSFSAQLILSILGKVKLSFIFVILGIAALIYFMLPAFQGNFIDPAMRVKIPNEYLEMYKWFDSQNPAGRVAKLPLQTFWDWNFYSWGYQGGGFTWFGIPQPTLDREFDRWGLYNEDFYFQASDALYGNDPQAFVLALKKYQVKYLLLDESVINAGGSPSLLYISQIKDLVSKSGSIHEVAKFGFLTVYETNFDVGNNFISAPKTEINNIRAPLVRGNLIINVDLAVNSGFAQAYNCDIKKDGTVYKQNSQAGIDYKADGGGVSCDYLDFSDLKYDQAYVLHIAGQNKEGRSLKIYLVNYLTGKANLEELLPSGSFDKEFSIYPSKLEGAGYSLNFETRSYGPIASENLVTKVEVYTTVGESSPPEESDIGNNLEILNVQKYGTWAYMVETSGNGLLELGQGYDSGWKAFPTGNVQFKIYNLQINLEIPNFKQELKHVKVNSWANGWLVADSKTVNRLNSSSVFIFFWPQLLEWGGGILGLAALIVLVLRRKNRQVLTRTDI